MRELERKRLESGEGKLPTQERQEDMEQKVKNPGLESRFTDLLKGVSQT